MLRDPELPRRWTIRRRDGAALAERLTVVEMDAIAIAARARGVSASLSLEPALWLGLASD